MLKSLRFRIILSSAACILIVGVFSNVFLYRYLTGIIADKSDSIDRLNLQTVQTQLNRALEELAALSMLGAYDVQIARGMRNEQMATVDEKRSVINAQNALQRYLNAQSSIEPYVSRLIVFNEHGVRALAAARSINSPDEVTKVMRSEAFQSFEASGERQLITVAPSIVNDREYIVCLSRIYEPPSSFQRGWLYIELDPAYIEDALSPYPPGSLFVTYGDSGVFPAEYAGNTGLQAENLTAENTLALDGRVYKFQNVPLRYAGLSLYSRTDVTFLSADSYAILFTTVVVMLTSLAAALVLAALLGGIITKPLNRLTAKLKRVSENDFSRESAIETGGGEIAEMGRVVNDMTESIANLLRETEDMYIRQKNSEIALLQSQVNPHFLYNTLDTIRWMAVIQKNPGIEKTVRSLSNLLKNLAKGVGDKITLEEELSLLKDYIDTQSVRFMELLEFEENIPESIRGCSIVKFTLQPLVENAIFHGIEPSGEFGRISVGAREEGEYILILVEDNGVGMSPEELASLQSVSPHTGGMSGIGVTNVDSRLKLVYGNTCGLSYESEPGKFTRVTVRIRKEGSHVPGTAG